MSGEPAAATIPGLEPDHIKWLAETVRVTAFAMPGAALATKSWKDVFGAEPQEVMRQPAMPSIYGGVRDGIRWLITDQPGRADIMMAPETPSSPPTDPLTIGEFEAALSSLLVAAGKTFDPATNIQRLAVGAVLLSPVDSIREGLRKVEMNVPQLRKIPANSSDFLFQVNVPTVINDPIPELLVNRLVRWQVTTIHVIGMLPGSGMFPQLTTTASRPVVRLELDVNTSPERPVEFPADKFEVILNKLGEIARGLSETGEFQ